MRRLPQLAVQLARGIASSSDAAVQGRPPAPRRYGVVIDGDVFGPRHFPALLAAVRRRGYLVSGVVCTAAPPRGARPAWPSELSFVAVPRGKGGKDPNDIAVAFEAARLAFREDKVDAIAVAAPDTDFLFLLERLEAQGIATLALLPLATEPGVAQAFQAVAEVERFRTDEPAERRPTKKIVLQAEGWSSIEDLGAAEFGTGQVDPVLLNSLRVKLCELNYLQGH
ncbi:unnamed protein product, partial [Symbiodinium necroappetens]